MMDKLRKIFNENYDKRICVLGTTCTGKTTIIEELNMGIDMDDAIFPLLSDEETKIVCTTPWTEEIGQKMDEFVKTKLSIKSGLPMFGTVLLDSDLIIYLHIDDDLLFERTNLRNVDFMDAKRMQNKIEEEIKNSKIDTIVVNIENIKKNLK